MLDRLDARARPAPRTPAGHGAERPARRPRHHALHHRAAAAAGRPARGGRRGHRRARRLPRGRRLAAHRRVHRRGRRATTTGSTSGSRSRSRAARSRSPTCSPRSAAAQSHLLLPDGAYFSLDKPELRQLAQPDRGGPGAAGRARRPAADQPVPGRAVGRAGRARRGRPPGPGVAAAGTGTARRWATPRPSARAAAGGAAGRSCVPTSWTGSSGWRSCGSTGSAASSPTTWGWARRSQTLALICHARQADPGGAPFLVVAPTSVVPNWAAEAARFAPEPEGGDRSPTRWPAAAPTWPRSSRAPTSWSPRTRCCGSTSTPTRRRTGPG